MDISISSVSCYLNTIYKHCDNGTADGGSRTTLVLDRDKSIYCRYIVFIVTYKIKKYSVKRHDAKCDSCVFRWKNYL